MKKQAVWLLLPLIAVTALVAGEAAKETEKTGLSSEVVAPAMARDQAEQNGDQFEGQLLPASQEIDVAAIQARRVARARLAQIKARKSREARVQPDRARPARHPQQRGRPTLKGFSFRRGDSALRTPTVYSTTTLFKSTGGAAAPTVLINGVSAATIVQGDDMVITITFSTGQTAADVAFWIDMNGNGTLDETIDFDLEESDYIVDNDVEDENPNAGVYQITFARSGGDGLTQVAPITWLAVVTEASGERGTASATITPLNSAYSISGSVTPPVANVIIIAELSGEGDPEGAEWITVTDVNGQYQLFVAEPGFYDVFSIDFLGVQGGLIYSISYSDVDISAHLTGYDFVFVEPTSFIQGTVTDNTGAPVGGIGVRAEDGLSDITDATGAYSIGVIGGEYYRVRLNGDDLVPAYLVPEGQEVYVAEGATVPGVDFTLYVADATITGTVTLDGSPIGGIEIRAEGKIVAGELPDVRIGFTAAESGADGTYTLHVSSAAGIKYDLGPRDLPAQTIFTDELRDILPGATGVDIHLLTVTGGLTGAVIVAGSSPPDTLFGVQMHIEAREVTTDVSYTTHTDIGTYTLYLPPGTYTVHAQVEDGDGFYGRFEGGPLVVGTDLVPFDIALELITGGFTGAVIVAGTTPPDTLFGLSVHIGAREESTNDTYHTDSDPETGVYTLYLPPGSYLVHIDGLPVIFKDYGEQGPVAVGTELVTFDIALQVRPIEPPVITAIVDRSPDQGGWVYLSFDSGHPEFGHFAGWSIWSLKDPGALPRDWINLGFVAFHGETSYTALVPTSVDSNATTGPEGAYWSYFVVSGHEVFDLSPWWDSAPDSGYSVDNIAPGVPASLQIAASTSGVQLSWDASSDDDFAYFAVYRAEVSGNYGALPYAAVVENAYEDAALTAGATYYYVVTAFDANGNESEFSEEMATVTLGVDGNLAVPEVYALRSNYPNPFNPSTTIVYELPEAGPVSLKVYDLTGKHIRTLVNESVPAGYFQVVWDGRDAHGAALATGVYFYRLVASQGYAKTLKMVLMK